MAGAYKNPLRDRFPREFFSGIPQTPGVYFMKCRKGSVLYIGKATSLRDRVRSYRNARPDNVGSNIIQLLNRVRQIEWEQHRSEQDAFDRELELIRAFVPRYNIADAWNERYLFIGLRRPSENKLEFRLTHKAEDAEQFSLHGCYPRRTKVKDGYSALLRVVFACTFDGHRFQFPARITRPAPAYEYSLRIKNATEWQKTISAFLHGRKSRFLQYLVGELLRNEEIPEYVRPGLQRDLKALAAFERICLKRAKLRDRAKRVLNHEELRQEIQNSI